MMRLDLAIHKFADGIRRQQRMIFGAPHVTVAILLFLMEQYQRGACDEQVNAIFKINFQKR